MRMSARISFGLTAEEPDRFTEGIECELQECLSKSTEEPVNDSLLTPLRSQRLMASLAKVSFLE